MRFYTKQQAMNQRRQIWCCLECGSLFVEKVKFCNICATPDRIHYFPSRAELKRYQSLKLLEKTGDIGDLVLQPVFPIVVNGQKICDYRADFQYMHKGELIIEDVKGTTNPKHHPDLFKLKIKLVKAIYGIDVTITK